MGEFASAGDDFLEMGPALPLAILLVSSTGPAAFKSFDTFN